MFPTDGRGSTSWDKCPCGRIPHTRRILGQPARAIGACPCIHCTCRGSSMSPCYRALLSSSRGRHVGPTVLEPGYRLSLQYHLLTLAGDNDASRRPCGHLSHRLPASYGRRSQFRDERRGTARSNEGLNRLDIAQCIATGTRRDPRVGLSSTPSRSYQSKPLTVRDITTSLCGGAELALKITGIVDALIAQVVEPG